MTTNKPGQGKINTHRRFKSVNLLAFSLALVFLLSNPVLAYDPLDVGVWHFETATGDTAFDSTTNNYDLTEYLDFSWTSTAKYGSQAVETTSIEHQGLRKTGLNYPTSHFTLGFWIQDNTTWETDWASPFEINQIGTFIFIRNTGTIGAGFSGYNGIESTIDTYKIDSNWHHVAWVVDDDEMFLYYDAVLVASGPSLVSMPFTITSITALRTSGEGSKGVRAKMDDAFLTARALTPEQINIIYTSPDPYSGSFVAPADYLRPPPTLTLPTPSQEIVGNFVNVQGTCWHPGVEILNETTTEVNNFSCQYPTTIKGYFYYDFKEDINFSYDQETGRPGGYVEFTTPPGHFAGLIRNDANDLKITKYNNDLNYFMSDLEYWFEAGATTTTLKFFAEAEVEGREGPKFYYSLVYGYQFEDQPFNGTIAIEPTTDYFATRGPTQDIKGVFDNDLFLDYGEYTISARTWFEFPGLNFTEPTPPVIFTLIESLTPPPPYSWTDPVVWYGGVSKFDQPTAFLGYIFDLGQGTLSPLMSKMDNFSQFFDTTKAQEDALNITQAIKVVISYTKLFDNFFGSFPVSWALILLIIVYVAKFVIIYTAKAIQTFKPF